jgi:TDG/mug DNA glycosylase family protein
MPAPKTLRPTPTDLEAAPDRTVPDVIGPGIDLLFCGINPGIWSGATGHHFARPGNRFWKVLHGAGFTPTLLHPSEERRLVEFGIGITNLVARVTATAAELNSEELRTGAELLAGVVGEVGPRWVAFLGVGAYRSAFGRRQARIGPQPERLGPAGIWLLPNPSGLQARYQLPQLIDLFTELREASAHSGL